MNLQLMFDDVTRHLLTQKKRSVLRGRECSGADVCAYRDQDGLMCAIGSIVPDNLYKEEFENSTVSSLIYTIEAQHLVAHWQEKYDIEDLNVFRNFATELQGIHDDQDPQLWQMYLKEFAGRHDLTMLLV